MDGFRRYWPLIPGDPRAAVRMRIAAMFEHLRAERGGAGHQAEVCTADRLRELLAAALAEIGGGDRGHWLAVIGSVHRLPMSCRSRSNWAVVPNGLIGERRLVMKVASALRQTYPYVEG